METDHLLSRYQAECMEPNSIHPKRQTDSLRILRHFAASLDHPLDRMTAADVNKFIGAEVKRGVHPRTAGSRLVMIRSLARWAYDAGLIEDERMDELESLRKPRGASAPYLPKPYTPAEIRRFYEILDTTYPMLPSKGPGSKAIRHYTLGKTQRRGVRRLHTYLQRHARRLQYEAQVALALECGLRTIEISRLSIEAVHPEATHVVVLTAKQGPGVERYRAVPHTAHTVQVIAEWLDFRECLLAPHDNLWLDLNLNGDIHRQLRPMVYEDFKDTLKVFGPGWRWHRFRHTAATEWLRAGVPLEKLRIFMGHATIDQTLAYTEIIKSDIDRDFSRAEASFAARLGLAA